MPPYVYGKDDEGFYKPFQYLHPALTLWSSLLSKSIDNAVFKENQPHVFQQSVTLTASMWNENDSRKNMDWHYDNWQIFGEYSSLFVGLACGFGIVLLVMSTVMLWRYCILSAAKKVCCQSKYGEINCRQKSLQRKKDVESQNGFEHFQNLSTTNTTLSTLQRSATMNNMSWNCITEYEKDNKLRASYENINCNIFSHSQTTQTIPFDSVLSPELYTSHLYLHNLHTMNSENPKTLSRSTPDIEELYAKVNFSKKKKNRMRKDEAAIIAMSKSHSRQNNNSLDLFGSAIVVYNERTAL